MRIQIYEEVVAYEYSTANLSIFADAEGVTHYHPWSDPIKTLTRALCLTIIYVMSAVPALSQPSNFIRLPKLTIAPGGYDTVGHKNAVKVAEESLGIVEKTIDPDLYLMGPNDVLTVAINGPQALSFDVTVSPDGKALIPAVPAVDVRGLTLSQTQVKITSAVRAVYKSQSVDILLKKLKIFKVIVYGAVRKPTEVSASSADRVSEVIDRAGGIMYNASLRKIMIERDGGRKIPVDILKFFSTGKDSFNPQVYSGDKIYVPYVIDEDCISVQGSVYQPGMYEYVPGDSLFTMLQFAQGMTMQSLVDSVEVTRYEESGQRTFRTFVNASTNLGNVPLRIGDKVYVRQRTDYFSSIEVAIDGGIAHPGRYSINPKTDRLADLIERAGGYTDDAQPETGLLFRRKDFTWMDKELDRLSKIKPEDMNENEMRYYRTKSSENMGLVSVDFEKIKAGSTEQNPILINKDSVFIPRSNNYVNLIGRVIRPGRIPFVKGFNYSDYVAKAGGFGLRADEDEVLIQKVSGELHRAKDYSNRLSPGDNILIPERSDVKFIDVFTKALSITAQLATIVGVVVGVAFAYKK